MTTFRTPVRRRTNGEYAVLYRKARPIVVRLAPGDVIEFRELGRRQRWALNADIAFRYAVRLKALAESTRRQPRKARQ